LFVGRVAHNQAIIDAFEEVLSLKEGEWLYQSITATSGRLGRLSLRTKKIKMDVEHLLDFRRSKWFFPSRRQQDSITSTIFFGTNDSMANTLQNIDHDQYGLDCYLGIDVGSTSTNLVVSDANNQIICFKYLRTPGILSMP
jgi:hypothetical protein